MSIGARGGITGGLLLAGLILFGQPQAAMYKWVDDNGVTQYSQYPPPGKKSEVMVPPPSPADDPEGAHQKLEDTLKKQAEERKARAEAQEEQAKSEAESERRQKNCKAAKSNLEKLTTGGRKRFIGPDGVATYLTEEERQAKIAEAKEQIKENCATR